MQWQSWQLQTIAEIIDENHATLPSSSSWSSLIIQFGFQIPMLFFFASNLACPWRNSCLCSLCCLLNVDAFYQMRSWRSEVWSGPEPFISVPHWTSKISYVTNDGKIILSSMNKQNHGTKVHTAKFHHRNNCNHFCNCIIYTIAPSLCFHPT